MKYSESELEDIKYETWLLAGGPEKLTAKNKQAAISMVKVLQAHHWQVLSQKMIKPFMQDARVTELVIRKGDKVHILEQSQTKYWMKHNQHCGGKSIWSATS